MIRRQTCIETNRKIDDFIVRSIYLTFHGLGEPPPFCGEDNRPYWVPVGNFRQIVASANFREISGYRVVFTFDDGYRSDVTTAMPILMAHGRSGLFFASSELVGAPGYLSRADIAVLSANGMTIGSHGAAHINWTLVSDAEVKTQLVRSLEALSDWSGCKVDQVSVPFGAYDWRVLRILRRLDVANVYTSDGDPFFNDGWLRARQTIRIDTCANRIHRLLTGRSKTSDRFRSTFRTTVRSFGSW